MEATLKMIRTEIDSLAKLTAGLPPTREVSLAKTHFQESKMSLGKVLGEIGSPNPYPESKNPNSPVIEKTADTGTINKLDYTLGHVANVKQIRQFADEVCNKIKGTKLPEHRSDECQLFFEDAFLECHKGMMWLGMELGRIREVEEADAERKKDIPQTNGNASTHAFDITEKK